MYAFYARIVINAFDELSRPYMYLQTKISLSIQNIKLLFQFF